MKKVTTITAISLIVTSVNFKTSFAFSDVEKTHWANKQIEEYSNRGILLGYSDGTFKPNQNITRAEFIKIMNKTFNINSVNEDSLLIKNVKFNDIKGHWAEQEIIKALSNNIYDCMSEDDFGKSLNLNFRPNDYITREEACDMISNYLNINDDYFIDSLAEFKDYNQVSSWAINGLQGALDKNIIKGYKDNTIKPKGKLTRAEAVLMINRSENHKYFFKSLNNVSDDMNIEELQKYVNLFSDYDKELLSNYDERNFDLGFALEYIFNKNLYTPLFDDKNRIQNVGYDESILHSIDKMKISDMEDEIKKIFGKEIKLQNKEYRYTHKKYENSISKFKVENGFVTRYGPDKSIEYYIHPSQVIIDGVYNLGKNYYLLNVSSSEVEHDGSILDLKPDYYSIVLKKNKGYYSLMRLIENQDIEVIKEYIEEISLKKN